jgi:hypothetical protein
MFDNELSDFLFVGSEFEFSSSLTGAWCEAVGVVVLFAEVINTGETDGIFFCDLCAFDVILAIVQDTDSQVERVGSGHRFSVKTKIKNTPLV